MPDAAEWEPYDDEAAAYEAQRAEVIAAMEELHAKHPQYPGIEEAIMTKNWWQDKVAAGIEVDDLLAGMMRALGEVTAIASVWPVELLDHMETGHRLLHSADEIFVRWYAAKAVQAKADAEGVTPQDFAKLEPWERDLFVRQATGQDEAEAHEMIAYEQQADVIRQAMAKFVGIDPDQVQIMTSDQLMKKLNGDEDS
jgi:hypothetical protein